MVMQDIKDKIIIDPNQEMTQADYAKYVGVDIKTVSAWVRRNKVKFRRIPELNNLVLIQIR